MAGEEVRDSRRDHKRSHKDPSARLPRVILRLLEAVGHGLLIAGKLRRDCFYAGQPLHTGCAHAPHQGPVEWSEKYKGAFDQRWDKLREETF